MAVSLCSIVIDAHDPPALARFWCAVLDWTVVYEAEDELVIGADESALPVITFVPAAGEKTAKNRLHIDLDPDDRDTEVARAIGLGARRADVGQRPDASWVVLTDPEGNEFCVLSSNK
ncbi:VOC family protein [Streptomyces sp. NPDC058195]|uniref:VOC family protein n=1 Tax=Streptomyces sp. NPDC058195 TaxID=3346375 RepID=UPI0036EAE0DD